MDWGPLILESRGRKGDMRVLTRRGMRTWLRVLIIGAVCFAASPAAALEWEALAGYSSDFGNSSFAYAGVGLEEPVSNQFALRTRLLFSYLTYEFEEEGETVEAEAPAVTMLLGLKYQLRPDMALSLFGGGQVKRTRFDRDDSDTRNDDGGVAQLEYYYQLSPKADVLVLYTYTSAEHFNWGRVAAKREVLTLGPKGDTILSLGLEGIGMGGEDFTAVQGGPLLEIRHRPLNGSLLLSVGPKYFSAEETSETRPYLSLGFYFRF